MSILKVIVVTTNRPNEKLALTFTNLKAAHAFRIATLTRNDVVSCTIDGCPIKSFSNVESALDALDFWSK